MIYDKNGQNLSLDGNGNPVMGGLTEAGEIRQVKLTDNGEIATAGTATQKIPDVTGAEVLNYFNFNLEGGDFVTSVSTANGQRLMALVIDPLTDDKRSTITQNVPIKTNAHVAQIEASMNIRPRHQFTTMEMSSTDTITLYPTYNITSLQQATTTLTIVMTNPVDWTIGDWINIAGCSDNRLNYPNFCIATISVDMKTITGTTADEVAIQSLTVGPFSNIGMTAQKTRQLIGADGYGMRFSGTTATAVAYLSKFSGNITKASGTLVGSQLLTNSTSAPIFTSGATGQVDIRASSRYFVRCDTDMVSFMDKLTDTNTTNALRNVLTGVKPAHQNLLYAKYNAVTPKSTSRPIAKIVSIAKTGTTTATVTTNVPHGLTTSNYITIKGVRDQTNFPVLTAPTVVASTPTATTFTIVIGSAVTATSYGGSVIIANGGVDQPGIVGQIIQTIAVDSTNKLITLVGNTTWTGLNIGEYVLLHGVRDNATGADLGYDGKYEVVTLSTTTLIVKPIIDYLGVNISPTLSTLTTTNCGGTVILMTTLRSHDSVFTEYTPFIAQIDGQGTLDLSKALPVNIANSISGTVTQGTASAPSATTGLGGWYINPANVGVADIASAALTSSNTTAAIANAVSNAYQVVIPVSAVSGTTPTMDVTIQESDDGGTNWFSVYQFPRITATGVFRSPILPVIGRNIRYVQNLGGTTPSFTRTLTRTVFPTQFAKPTRLLRDFTFNVNGTLGTAITSLLSDPCNNLQLIIRMGAITTTAPAMQLQGSDDGGANWYSIGSPLTGVASSTVQITVNNVQTTLIRAVLTTAGVGATLGEITIKAFS